MYDSAKTYSALCRHIWRQGELLRLSVSAKLLCLALVEIRSRYDDSLWFTSSITDLHLITGLSPTTVKSAIRELEEAGLIEHQSGTSRAEPSRYRICNVVGKRPAKLPELLPDKQPDKLPENLPGTPINSNEDKSVKDKEENSSVSLSLSHNTLYPVETLSSLISDTEWMANIRNCVLQKKKRDVSDELIRARYDEFMNYLLAKGKKAKTVADMKSHFVNWLLQKMSYPVSSAVRSSDNCILYDDSPDKFKTTDYADD